MIELQKYSSKLAIYIPHYHPPNSDINFAILPTDLVQVRNGNIITFEPKNKIENNKDFQPSGWIYKNEISVASYEKSNIVLFDITKIKDIENILSFLSEYNLGVTFVNGNIDYKKDIEVEEPCGKNQIIKVQKRSKYSGKVADSTVIFIGNNLEAARCCDPQRLNGHIQKKH